MGGYANGQIPGQFLAPAYNAVAPGQQFEAQTAVQWEAMCRTAEQQYGVTLRPQSETDGVRSCYRDLANQQWTWDNRGALGVSAAYPGTSNHGFGNACDVDIWGADGIAALAWLRMFAYWFGFDNVEGASVGEAWHWVRTRYVEVGQLLADLRAAATPADILATPSDDTAQAEADADAAYRHFMQRQRQEVAV